MKNQNSLYRQGDVLFKSVPKLPTGERTKRKNGTVAYGEVTGHAHRLEDLESAEVLEIGNGLYVHVTPTGVSVSGNTATFIHEEHGPITLPGGDYEVVIQREYSPEGIRSVVD